MAAEIESVSLTVFAREDEVAAVEQAFARAGFQIDARADVETRSDHWGGAAAPWLIYVMLAVPISAFFAAFGSEAGKDAYAAVKEWTRDIFAVHQKPHYAGGTLDIRDPRGTRVVLSPPLPDEALDALADIDWASVEGGDLLWDERRREWRDAMRG